MTTAQAAPGDRIELQRWAPGEADAHSNLLRPGTIGTVRFVDDLGTVHIRFDNGITLGLGPADQYRILDAADAAKDDALNLPRGDSAPRQW